ncbi:hypothetical protein [Marinobacterium sp. BA1]|uniref:hypothetical protein n=1 Tax=Marinobacterium sp. BA1 TaxID=3138931 RepID=UPI0034E8F348
MYDTVILVKALGDANTGQDASYCVMLNSSVVMESDSEAGVSAQYVQDAAGAIADGVCVNAWEIEVTGMGTASEAIGALIDDHALDQGIEGIAKLLMEQDGGPTEGDGYSITDMRVRYDLGSDGTTSANPEGDFDIDSAHFRAIRHAAHAKGGSETDFMNAAVMIRRECRTLYRPGEVVDDLELLADIRAHMIEQDPLAGQSASPSPAL